MCGLNLFNNIFNCIRINLLSDLKPIQNVDYVKGQ